MKKLSFILFLFLLIPFLAHAAGPVKILIVPGHDDEAWGTQFKNVKEADMNVKLGLMLYNKLKKDKNFEVYITRDWEDYRPEFKEYFSKNGEAIADFIKEKKTVFNGKMADGEIDRNQLVEHNTVNNDVATKLYGLNKWADENNIDAMIHIHFNDYPRGRAWERGDYKGFAIYTPEHQMNNFKESFQLASFVFQKLFHDYAISNYPPEKSGVVPDQELIAIGAFDTLHTRSILIEYGYIYERKFSTVSKRATQMRVMAEDTYQGIKKYFDYIAKQPIK